MVVSADGSRNDPAGFLGFLGYGWGRMITFLALVHMLNADNVWHETGQMMNNQKRKKVRRSECSLKN